MLVQNTLPFTFNYLWIMNGHLTQILTDALVNSCPCSSLTSCSIESRCSLTMLNKMTKSQLLDSVAAATGQSKSETERVFDAVVEHLAQALTAGERIDIRGLGVFTPKKTKARTGRNPRTGETVTIAASRKVTFRPSKELKDRLTAPPANDEEQSAGSDGKAFAVSPR